MGTVARTRYIMRMRKLHRDSTGAMITVAEAQGMGLTKTDQHFTQLAVALKASKGQRLAVVRNHDGSYDLWAF